MLVLIAFFRTRLSQIESVQVIFEQTLSRGVALGGEGVIVTDGVGVTDIVEVAVGTSEAANHLL